MKKKSISILFYLFSALLMLLLLAPIIATSSISWWLDNLLNLQLQWSLIAMLLIASNILFFKRNRLLITAFFSMIVSYNMLPLYWPTTQILHEQTAPKHLNIAQLNLSYDNPNLEYLTSTLGNTNFDLLVLQEVSDDKHQKLQKLKNHYPYSFGFTPQQSTPAGMAIFSRWPISEQRIHQLGYKSGIVIELIIQHPITHLPLQVFTLHPGSPRNEKLWEFRNKTLHHLTQLVSHSPLSHIIVVGDFNSSHWTPSFKALLTTSQLNNSAQGFGYIPSWSYSKRTPFSLVTSVYIDHLLFSDTLSLVDKRYQSIQGSDHRLLLTQLAI